MLAFRAKAEVARISPNYRECPKDDIATVQTARPSRANLNSASCLQHKVTGYMRRRDFIKAVIGSAGVWPLAAVAQPADQLRKKVPRIGFLASVPHERIDAFDRGLREHGYAEGENIIIERRFWKNDPEQLAKCAAELVALDVEVIVAPTTPEALAAKALTSTIPIVTATADAVGVGLAASFARPGGNVTGLTAVGGSIKNSGSYRSCCREQRVLQPCSTLTTAIMRRRWSVFRMRLRNDTSRFCRW